MATSNARSVPGEAGASEGARRRDSASLDANREAALVGPPEGLGRVGAPARRRPRSVSGRHGVTAATLSAWRDEFLTRCPSPRCRQPPERHQAHTDLVSHEQRWLPVLAPLLPLPIPVPVRTGRPGCGFPWTWSIVPWLDGQSAATAPPADGMATAVQLGEFLRALHHVAPSDAPRNPWRGVPLENRTPTVLERVAQLGDRVDNARIRTLSAEMVRTPHWPGPPLWLHGDLIQGICWSVAAACPVSSTSAT